MNGEVKQYYILHRVEKKLQFSFFHSFCFLLLLLFLCLEKFTEKLSSNKSAWGQNELIHWYFTFEAEMLCTSHIRSIVEFSRKKKERAKEREAEKN